MSSGKKIPMRTKGALKPVAAGTNPVNDAKVRTLTATQCRRLFEQLRRINPTPTTELNYRSPFELLIAVMLSAQATDKSVNKVTGTLFTIADCPEQMLALGEDGVRQHIKSIGLFNTKARNIILTCTALIERHNGNVPDSRAALEALPGVGRKTANVILNTAFGQPTIAVDTHIFRVANRTGLAPGKNVREVEQYLTKCVPRSFQKDAHHWLILHGRYTCKMRKPLCGQCAIASICSFPTKTQLME